MNVLSLFDGMSCGQIALERAGITVDRYFASEVDKYAIQITQKNYPNTVQLGDVREWRNWQFPKIDLLLAGSPCQGFSIAGKLLNFEDPRSKLFFEFVDILEYYKPKHFLLENVKMKKEWKGIISNILEVEPVEINSALVSAQNRKRLYWANFPITQPEDKGIYLKDIVEEDAIPVTFTERRTEKAKEIRRQYRKYGKDFSPRREKELVTRTDGKSNCLTANLSNKEHIVAAIKQNGVWKNKSDKSQCLDANYWKGVDNHGQRTMIQVASLYDNNADAGRIYSVEGKARTLKGEAGGGGAKMGLISFDDGVTFRKLTPLECERLQTVPEGYTEGVSDTQRYKMLGNGWTVDVIVHILKGIKNNDNG